MKKLIVSCLALFILFLCVTKIDHFKTCMLLEPRSFKGRSSFNFEEIGEIVKCPLHYIGNGLEAIAFVTADDKYVVKFFLKKAILRKRFFKPKKRIRQLIYNDNVITTGYESLSRYEDALETLSDETCLLAVHGTKIAENLPSCTIIDYRGIEHRINLNEVAFVIQKKAKIISLDMNLTESKEVKGQLYELFSKISEKGFVNLSPVFNPVNFATLDNQAVMIDLGKLKYAPQDAYDTGRRKFQERYLSWVEKNSQRKIKNQTMKGRHQNELQAICHQEVPH